MKNIWNRISYHITWVPPTHTSWHIFILNSFCPRLCRGILKMGSIRAWVHIVVRQCDTSCINHLIIYKMIQLVHLGNVSVKFEGQWPWPNFDLLFNVKQVTGRLVSKIAAAQIIWSTSKWYSLWILGQSWTSLKVSDADLTLTYFSRSTRSLGGLLAR